MKLQTNSIRRQIKLIPCDCVQYVTYFHCIVNYICITLHLHFRLSHIYFWSASYNTVSKQLHISKRVTQFQFSVCMYGTCDRIDNKADFDFWILTLITWEISAAKFINYERLCSILVLIILPSKYNFSSELDANLQFKFEWKNVKLIKIKKNYNFF